MLAWVYSFHIPGDKDAFALRHALRLDDESNLGVFLLIQSNLVLQLTHFIRQQPGLWEKLVVFGELALHLLKVSR